MRQHSIADSASGRAAQSGTHVSPERTARRLALDLSGAADRQLVADALRALLRERSEALHLATRIAAHHRRPRPDPGDFGLSDILRLARLVERGDVADGLDT
ncbi:hypothetical protein [Paraburkholderia phosphatilytica]|uniref:hypothetical protein n=1 Tax=Paraburkholderia phosphatilytica TaxID=2282883 RepID=UPI001F0BFCE3|nr:hypothetical protein [Paraburkholderia phosphatilytica]